MDKKSYLLHLIGEISNYILDGDPSRMLISLHQEPSGLHMCIIDNNKDHSDEEIEKMLSDLNSQKRPELSGYYGAMTGTDCLGGSRLDLLGWQVKHTDIERTSSGIKIDLWIGDEQFNSKDFTIPEDKV